MKAPLLKINIIVITILFTFNSYSQVVLNELMVRPPGTVATPPNGLIYNSSQEYIEIYNSGCSQVNISGYFIAMKQSLSGTNTGGTYKIPNVPAAILDPGEHVVIGSANPGGTVVGNIDIPMAAVDYCNYNGNYVLANTDGWCALYNASGVAIDCVYWSSSASNLTSNTSDFNPGVLCLPTGSPSVTLQTPFQLNTSNPSIVRYGGINPIAGSPLSRQQDGSNTWVQNLASSIAANNCNGGTCVTPSSAPPAPTVTTPVNYCIGATAVPLSATASAGGTLNWYGTNATGGTASPTAPTPSTATAGSTTYYVSQTVAGCEGPRVPIVVTITSGGNLGLFCDTANSTPTSLTFDFSNVGQTSFTYSYTINGGAPITGTHISPSNFTVSGLTSGASVTFTLTANGVSCVLPQTVTCSTVPVDCGSCSTPNCPIIGVANYGVRNFPAGSCSIWSPALTNTVAKNHYLVQADANGFVGLIQQASGSPALCITRTAILRPLSTSCNVASNVNPSVVNANSVGSGFNPEWYGLTPNAQYIIEVTITLGAGCTLDSLCSNYYGCTNPNAPTASATIQPTCSTPTGTIVVTSPVGAGNEYSINGTTFQTSPTFSGLAPNTYSVIVKKTPSGCTSSATNITINTVPIITAPIASATVQPTCTVSTGTLVVSSPIGANFEYSINGTTFQSSPTFSGLTPNTYNVIVKNLTTGCISTSTIVIINSQPVTPNVPTIASVAATCSAAGTSSISNYSATTTYTFSPATAGITVNASGLISGMTVGTSYTVTATVGGCTSAASASFTNAAQLPTPAVPTIASVAATCTAAGTSSISNYNATATYTFSPATAGITVNAFGLISGMTVGTSYTVTSTIGGCTSAASASFSNAAQLSAPAVPTIASVSATCSSVGTSTISNYSTTATYTFSPATAGITVNASGLISGMTVGTSYTVTATVGGCTSASSAGFSIGAQLATPAVPIITTVAPTCAANGSAIISNYTAGTTYVFSPAGPTVAVGGAISAMTFGTNYIVTATVGGCTSASSAGFSIGAQLATPAVPIITTVAPTCAANGSAIISNYTAGTTYVFSPAGPTVAVGGAISAMTFGTNYIVTATVGGCTSASSAGFSIGAQLATPAVPTITTVAPTCAANGSAIISNYTAGTTYVFSPAGPTVAVGGAISAMTFGTNYTVTATVGGCTSASSAGFSIGAQLIVPATPIIVSTPASCSNNGSSLISNYNAGLTYIFNPSGPSIASNGLINGMVYGTSYSVSASNSGCLSLTSSTFSNTIQSPIPIVIATPSSNTFCSGGTTNIQLTSNVPGATFSWTVTGGNVVGAVGGTGTSINQTLTVSQGTTSTVEVVYTIIAEANGCAGTPQVVRVQVNPIPDLTVASSTAPICSGETTNISFTGTIPGTVFSWVVTNVTGVAGASNGTGTSIQQTLTTTGLSQGSVTYQITPTFNGCTGTPQSVTVLVNPRPELFTNPTHPPLCSGEDTFILVSSFNPNTTLDWTVNPVGVDGALSGTATGSTTIEQVLTTTVDNVAGYVDYIITPTLDGCSGAPITVRVVVNPLPKPVVTDGAICVDEFGATFQTYTLNSGLDNATYDFVWYLDGVAIPNSNNATYTANTVGTYSVIATNSITNCVSEIVSANITATTPASSFTITQSEYFTGNAVLTVNVTGGSGTLMYSLDEGTLQSSNVFTNVSAGPHTIIVVDTQGCTYLVQTVFVINYPQYFTPNGDGINDGWFIAGLQDTDVIYIFDRYGKLIKQLKGEEKWDGTYNQVQLPSTDYWFTVDYDENGAKKQFKAHFAMKR
jgi:gliding motility-associated-like protein